MANLSSFRAGFVGPRPDIRFDHCTPFSRVQARAVLVVRTCNYTPVATRQTAALRMCLGHLMQAPPQGARPGLLSKPRQSLPFQCFANAIRDRNAYRLRTRHFAERRIRPLLRRSRHHLSTAAARCHRLGDGGQSCQDPARFRLLVIFLPPTTSARLWDDKHNNFIGPEGRACSNSDISQSTPLMQVTDANSGASGPRRRQITRWRQQPSGPHQQLCPNHGRAL